VSIASNLQELFRKLPSVDDVLRSQGITDLVRQDGQAAVADAAREVLVRIRTEITSGHLDAYRLDIALSNLPVAIEKQIGQVFTASLRPVINATGVVLHTNLGRAPLSQAAISSIGAAAAEYSNLEFDLEAGARGKRDIHVQRLFAKLLNSDAAYDVHTLVVNNCAAAVMLALNSLAEGGEVIVSRGELVEIGGSFRIPEVMSKSQAILREVGTTNRTRIADYERAITGKTKLLLRVHRSNFSIVGFTEQPSLTELVALGEKYKLPVMEDQGNGALFDLRSIGVRDESGVAESLRAGIDVITYSGDKLLGGPQAGILSGREDYIRAIRKNPMFRALRVDKLTYSALEATLMQHVRGEHDSIPVIRMMRMGPEEIGKRAKSILSALQDSRSLRLSLLMGESVIGGGTTPGALLPTFVLAISCLEFSADEFLKRLRHNEIPIIARVEDGRVLLDLRTVFPEQDEAVLGALKRLSN
jgi:L-seryl-tRNA(Ser) seleniumtransferase